jgi:quercetin dioxygenase-like cupin family protein
MAQIQATVVGVFLSGIVTLGVAPPTSTQQPPGASPVTRTELLKQVLPPGKFRNVQAAMIELGPASGAPRHRHDVAVVAYVLEGIVENQFDGGAILTHKAGDSWWEAPGTVHNVARNASKTERARLLVVYIGEEGKTATVPLS